MRDRRAGLLTVALARRAPFERSRGLEVLIINYKDPCHTIFLERAGTKHGYGCGHSCPAVIEWRVLCVSSTRGSGKFCTLEANVFFHSLLIIS